MLGSIRGTHNKNNRVPCFPEISILYWEKSNKRDLEGEIIAGRIIMERSLLRVKI